MTINIKKLNNNATIPTSGSKYAAGYDLYACIDGGEIIAPNDTIKIKTGIALQIPQEFFGAIFARSGIATNMGLRPANCVGVIDSDYRGEIIVAIHNDSNQAQVIRHGDRIAQLVIMPYLPVEFNEVESLDDTERGDGGFGSSGISDPNSLPW